MIGAASPRPATSPWVRAVIDYAGPVAFIVGFFAMHRNLAAATWWLVGGSVLSLVTSRIFTSRIAPMPLLWGGAALVFGLLSLVFHDTRFIKVKVTVVDAALGCFLLGSLFYERVPLKLLTFGRWSPNRSNPLSLMLGDAVKLSEEAWRKLTFRYGLFFLVMAALNEAVWRTQSDTTWALFRMPGLLILAGLFAVTQLPMMMREARHAEAARAAGELTQLQE